MTTTPPSYSPTSLISLRTHALNSQDTAPAEALNLWKPTALHDTHGHTQPFPFKDYPHGVTGTITTSVSRINSLFDDNMSEWDTPADDSAWGGAAAAAAAEQPTLPVTAADTAVTADAADTTDVTADSTVELAPAAVEVRKSSLADLANGDRDAITAHLAQGLGPHKLLPRFTSDNSDSSDAAPIVDSAASPTEPDGAASVVDESASSASALSIRKPAPHRKLQVVAQDVPLPQSPVPAPMSPASDGPSTPVAPTVIPEPAIVDNNDSRSSSVVIVETPEKDAVTKVEHLDPKATAWTPEITVEFLPPSRPVSPKHGIPSHDDVALMHCREAERINECSSVPKSWTVPTVIGAFAEGNFFDSPVTGGVHQKLLCHYSQYFAEVLEAESPGVDAEFSQIVNTPLWAVFRQWVYGRKLNMDIDLKTLVQLWRFGASIQAPLFVNTVADAIMSKTVTIDDVFEAADEIDALLIMVSSTSTFRLIISHMIILNGIQLDYKQYEKWPRTLVWSIACLSMSGQLYVKGSPCAYHLHSVDHNCMS